MDALMSLQTSGAVGWGASVTALLLAFGLGQAMALTYMHSFRGLSYSRAFVQAMALGPIVTCMLMLAIGDSVAAGLGIAGGLSIIRFRTTMRDPRDMVFIFAALGVGIVCGLQAFPAAVTGTVVFCVATALLHTTAYGARQQFDGVLRFASTQADAETAILGVLRDQTRQHVLVTVREGAQGDVIEHAYQIRMRAPGGRADLVRALEAIPGVRDVALHVHEPSLEL